MTSWAAIVCEITYTPGSKQRVCVRVCGGGRTCKQKTLVCQLRTWKKEESRRSAWCVEISQKWVVNVESAWYAVDNFQMAAICKAIWESKEKWKNMRYNLHSRQYFFLAFFFCCPIAILYATYFVVFLVLTTYIFLSWQLDDDDDVCCCVGFEPGLAAAAWAMFVCFGCKQLSVISDKLIWQSTGSQCNG